MNTTLMNTTLVNDGQTRWACETSDLIAALDRLGWTETKALGMRAYVEPHGIKTDDFSAYIDLCNAVSPIEDGEDTDADHKFTFCPAQNAWVWEY